MPHSTKVSSTRLRKDVRALVRIPSWQEVDTIAQFTLTRLREAGVRNARRDEDGNVIGSLGHGAALLLNAHLDTVGVEGFEGNPYAGRVTKNRLVGRGASDCKAGVATVLEIARLLAHQPLRRKVVFTLTVWEEGMTPAPNGSYGVARRVHACEAIVLDGAVRSAATMPVLAGCRGILRMNIHVRGTACHSSLPERGDNALYRAAEFIQRFREEFAPERMPTADFTIMGKPISLRCVATLTEAQAMQGRNIIPDDCLLGMDCRLVPGQDADDIIDRVNGLARAFGRGRVDPQLVNMIPGHICPRDELLAACRTAARANGFRAPLEIMGGRADSTIFQNEGNIPSVVFGPATGATAHTRNEYLDLPIFYRAAQACADAAWERARAEG